MTDQMARLSVGTVLHYRPSQPVIANRGLVWKDDRQPMLALVTFVHARHRVDVMVYDQAGNQSFVEDCPVLEDDEFPTDLPHDDWLSTGVLRWPGSTPNG